MAQLFIDSFDHYDTASLFRKWTTQGAVGSTNGVNSIDATKGRNSTGGLKLRTTSGEPGSQPARTKSMRLTPTMPAPTGDTVICGFGFRLVLPILTALTQSEERTAIFSVRLNGTTMVWFRLNTNGTITAHRGSTALVGATSVGALSLDTYAFLEFKVKIGNSPNGLVQCRINGSLTDGFDVSGLDTNNGGVTDTWDEIQLGSITGSNVTHTTCEANYDDLYLFDGSGADHNDFIGDCQIRSRYVTVPGTNQDFTPSAGNNEDNVVDAVPDDDATYNETETPDARDDFEIDPSPVAGATILGRQLVACARKTDFGTGKHKNFVRIGGVNYDGDERFLSDSYKMVLQQYPLSPATNDVWDDAELESAGYMKVDPA